MAALPSTSSASVPLDATARANALATAAAFAPASAGASAPTSASTSLSQAPAEVGSAVALATPAPATLVRASGVHEFNRLDETDLAEARELKLLRADMEVSHDANSADFGIAYEKKGGTKAAGCGTEVFPSQRSLQDRCKQLAMARGFQLIVSGSSTRPNGGGNVKYRCKKLHGQQFFDADTPAAELQCPFYINGYGNGAAWKITRACFLHNHYKFIGWRAPAAAPSAPPLAAPVVALSTSSSGDRLDDTTSPDAPPSQLSPAPQPVRMPMQRNTTLSTKSLCQMVTDEVNKFPAPGLVMARLDGKLIKRILLSRGHTINHMMASRIKRQLQLARVLAVRTSFQTLASYFKLVAAKNPGSLIQVETTELGVFKRAVFIPSAALHAFKRSRKLVALDHILPAWCDGADPAIHGGKAAKGADATTDDTVCGVYLKALCKDSNDDVVTFALALVTEETQANWEWFLTAVQTAAAVDMTEYVVIAGRTGGVAEAIASVWPQTPHRFCVRRIVEDELVLRHRVAALTPEKVQRIYDLARSESESEFNALRTELVRLSDAAVEHLDALPKKHWVKYAFLETFRKPTFNNVTCDLVSMPSDDDLFTPSATHTSWFGADPVRSSQPLATFSRYFLQLAELFRARRDALEQRSPKELVPMRLAQMERILQGSQRCESIPCANGAFMVRSLGHTRPQIYDTWRHVNLLDWECTCQEWQDRRFPCVHAIHAAELERRRIDTLYDTIQHSVEYYRESYAIDFAACPLEAAAGVLEADANLKSPVDAVLAAEESTEQRKPGPKPKAKRVM